MSQLKACCTRNFEKDKVLEPKIAQDGQLECYWDAQYFEMSCVGKKSAISNHIGIERFIWKNSIRYLLSGRLSTTLNFKGSYEPNHDMRNGSNFFCTPCQIFDNDNVKYLRWKLSAYQISTRYNIASSPYEMKKYFFHFLASRKIILKHKVIKI